MWGQFHNALYWNTNMAWIKGQGKGETNRVHIRLDTTTAAFYRRKAIEAGVSLSEFLRHTLHEGVIAENIHEVEARLQALIATIPTTVRSIPDDIALSLLTSEAMLTAIVTAQNIQVLYKAQDAAKAKMAKLKESV